MKEIVMFIKSDCPYCRQAKAWMESLMEESPEYRRPALTVIDEDREPEVAAKADYYYVPTYFVGGVKLHEGAATRERIQRVLEEALKD